MQPAEVARTEFRRFDAVFANRNLRRLELAYFLVIAADWAFMVGLGILAYEAGGATAVGFIGLARVLPAALGTPLISIVSDRYQRQNVLAGVAAIAAGAMAAAAIMYSLDANLLAACVIAGIQGLASTVFRPTFNALLPSIATSPEQLIAANSVSSTIEGMGTLVGPLMAGIVLITADAGIVFSLAAGVDLLATVLISGIRVDGPRLRSAGTYLASDLFAGFLVLLRDCRPRLVVVLFSAQAVVRGALNVLVVVLSFQLLHVGEEWVGFLSAAVGAGGILGGAAAVRLAGRRLAMPFALGLVLWGIPLMLLAIIPGQMAALLLLAAVGVGNAIEDVAGFTLLQRLVSDEVLARLFGLLFGLGMAGIGIGSIVAPALVGFAGPQGALLVTGILLPVLVAFCWRGLCVIDAGTAGPAQLELLQRIPLFAPLSVAGKEYVAASLAALHVPAGTEIIRRGDAGDRFYVIARGYAEVTNDSRLLSVCGPDEYFGEIALLRDSPRTATVTARDDMDLYTLDRAAFLEAVTGHPVSLDTIEGVVRERVANV